MVPMRSCNQEQAPPEAGVAEVIRVPGPAPQTGVQYPALVRRIRSEAGQLPVTDRFEEQANTPQQDADDVGNGPTGAGGGDAHLERKRHHPHDGPLK